MAPGARSKFGAPMFELKVFGRKYTVLKKVLASLLGFFGDSQWFCARDVAHPLPPRYAPVAITRATWVDGSIWCDSRFGNSIWVWFANLSGQCLQTNQQKL